MALKAGRVGVAPDQVDEFGNVKSNATSGYTKQEADAKFETQTAASEALALKQPITLEVPIQMLSGTKLTVESALNGLNNDKQNVLQLVSTSPTDAVEGATMSGYIYKSARTVDMYVVMDGVTATKNSTVLFKIPAAFAPVIDGIRINTLEISGVIASRALNIASNGNVTSLEDLSNASLRVHATWLSF